MVEADSRVLKAKFRPNNSYPTRTEPSTLVLILQDLPWIPQRGDKFARPAEASRDLLPERFPVDTGWQWLKAVCFEEESAKRIEERRRKREVAKELGFDDDEALDDAKRFAVLPLNRRRQILAEHEATVDLPDHESSDPDRRAENVRQKAKEASGRDTTIRPRSVSEHRDAVKEEAKPYLVGQYINSDDIMICQVCEKILPFKLSDGSYFFEAMEFLPELERRHYQNYLALCPNHSAMYRHAKDTADTDMKESFLGLTGNRFKIVLTGEDMTIYFTKTHIGDLRAVIESESGDKPEI